MVDGGISICTSEGNRSAQQVCFITVYLALTLMDSQSVNSVRFLLVSEN